MKKFFQDKKMDWKFRKAGEGHRLDEEKPKPIQSKPGKGQEHASSDFLGCVNMVVGRLLCNSKHILRLEALTMVQLS